MAGLGGMGLTSFRARMAMGVAIFSGAVAGYFRPTEAGSCTPGMALGSYICSGAQGAPGVDVTQVLPTMGPQILSVTTTDGFGIGTIAGNAFTLTGTGGLSFIDNYASIISGADVGISAVNNDSGDLTITTDGTTFGSGVGGIIARNYAADGALSIDAGKVSTFFGVGIDVENSGTGLLSITAVSVTGGLLASNLGGGGVSIEMSGTAKDNDGIGIYALNSAGAGSVYVKTMDVLGLSAGIDAHNHGDGGLTIKSYDTVTATDSVGFGIFAEDTGDGALSITTKDVSGGANAIFATNDGGGDLTIDTHLGSLMTTGLGGTAIAAKNLAGGGALSITTADVTGGSNGIAGRNYGNGDLTIDSHLGMVTGTNLFGIDARDYGAGALSITTADVTGGVRGIYAKNEGGGDLTIDSQLGTVKGTSPLGYGIDALNSVDGDTLSITTKDVSGTLSAIRAVNSGGAGLTIDSHAGTVTGNASFGINAQDGGAGALSITTADVTGGYRGISAKNAGGGDLTIDSLAGAVKATSNAGIYANNYTGGGILSITTKDVTGGTDGIFAKNAGSGDLTIDSHLGTVMGAPGRGIFARDYGAGSISITTADVTGDTSGINARNKGGGDLTIDSLQGVVTGAGGAAITVQNYAGGGTVSITTADVTGGSRGIYAENGGYGGMTIDSHQGTVMATLLGGTGIRASDYGIGALSITTKDVSGGKYGVVVDNEGGGDLTIDSAAGTVSGTSGTGIDGYNNVDGGKFSITTASVTGGTNGIFAKNKGGEDLTIDSHAGTVTGTSNAGIYALDLAAGALSITTADVTGGLRGIFAKNDGGGDLTIDSQLGTVMTTAANSIGIYAIDSGAGALSITAEDVSSGGRGIYAKNDGGGDLTIDSLAGTVTGTTDRAIVARDFGAGALSITTADVSGAKEGIDAINDGGGDLTIDSVAGTVTATDSLTGGGIFASDLGAGSVWITTAAVSGVSSGIGAFNQGGGDLTIDTKGGAVTATADLSNGIVARDFGSGTLSVTTADVTGKANGLYARNYGNGGLTVESHAGSVAATDYEGIFVRDDGTGALSITTADVTAGSRAIYARNFGGGDLTIETQGTVSGGALAIYAKQTGAGAFTVTNSGTLRNAALNAAGLTLDLRADTSGVTLDNLGDATIVGRANLTGQSDLFDNAGLWQAAGTSDFGAGVDELFNEVGGVIQTAFAGGVEAASFTGLETFRNAGLLRLQDGEVGDSVAISGDFVGEAGGTLWLDVYLDDGTTGGDRLTVGGAVGGAPTPIVLSVAGGAGGATGTGAGNGIVLVDVSAGSTAAGDFFLAEGPAIAGPFIYDLSLESDGIWYLQSTVLPAVEGYANLLGAAANQTRFVGGLLFEHLDELRHLPLRDRRPDGGQTAARRRAWAWPRSRTTACRPAAFPSG